MSRYLYKAYLRDVRAELADDQWWVCLLIEADTRAKAEDWGDKLTQDYCGRNKENRFVMSEVSLAATQPLASLDFPVIRYGENCSNKQIGW